jgi:hypothetical protein
MPRNRRRSPYGTAIPPGARSGARSIHTALWSWTIKGNGGDSEMEGSEIKADDLINLKDISPEDMAVLMTEVTEDGMPARRHEQLAKAVL